MVKKNVIEKNIFKVDSLKISRVWINSKFK